MIDPLPRIPCSFAVYADSILSRSWGAGTAAGAIGTLFARNFIPNEKKISHRIELPYGVNDPQFDRSLGQLLGPPLIDGNRVRALQNGDEIFPAMLAAIAGRAA